MPMRDHFYSTLIISHKKLQTRHTFNERHRSSELRATFSHVVVSVNNDPGFWRDVSSTNPPLPALVNSAFTGPLL